MQASGTKRTEMLTRFALNRGLKVVEVLMNETAAALPGQAEQQIWILKRSMEIALKFYESDREFLAGQMQARTLDPLSLPYAQFGTEFFDLLQSSYPSVIDASAQYTVAMLSLGLLGYDLYRDPKRDLYSPARKLIYDFQQRNPEIPAAGTTDAELIQKLRDIARVSDRVKAQLQAISSSLAQARTASSLPGSKFVSVAPGSFMMGSPENEVGRYNDEKRHPVRITRGFEMQTTELTQAQWVEVMGRNPSLFDSAERCPRSFTKKNGIAMCPNNPVENVRWDDVQQFLSKLNSTVRDGYVYRLPTEAEWEYAARAGMQRAYSFGSDSSQCSQYGWFYENSGAQTHEVGGLKPNAWGLYDMHGNVDEWVQDWYASNYGGPRVDDPAGPATGSDRVSRGGGYYTGIWSPSDRRLAARSRGAPFDRSIALGFRLVRTRL